MALQVIWSFNAEEDYKKVIEYLRDEWSVTVAMNFIEKAESRLESLAIHPLLGIVSEKDKNIRSIVITKHNKLYYQINSNTIEVLNIFDTRQSPDKNQHD